MNRRDFFKLLAMTLAGCVAPEWATERNNMQLGELLAKMGRGDRLTPQEQNQIRLLGNQMELNNSFVAGLQNGQGVLNVNEIRANTGEFTYPPVGVAVRLNIANITVATGSTGYTISWASKSYDDINMWDSATPTIITINVTGKYIIAGRALWNTSTLTGTRGYYVFNADTSAIVLNSTESTVTATHRHWIYDEINLTRGTRLSVMAKQFSGADATLTHARLTMRLLKINDAEAIADA